MKSTGEVMGIDRTFAAAFYKASCRRAGAPARGGVLLTLADEDKSDATADDQALVRMGYTLYATEGTASLIERARDAGADGHQADRAGPPRYAGRHPRRHGGDGDQHARPRLHGAAAGLRDPARRRRARHPLPHLDRHRRGDGERDARLRGAFNVQPLLAYRQSAVRRLVEVDEASEAAMVTAQPKRV